MPFPVVQDSAEAFLLQQSQVLISAPRPIWPQKPEPFQLSKDPLPAASSSTAVQPTAFLPKSLQARDKRLQKNDRVEERVALGSAFQPIDRDRRESVLDLDEDVDRGRRIPSPEESSEWKKQKLLAAKQKRKEEFERAKAKEVVYDLDGSGSDTGGRGRNAKQLRRASGTSAPKRAADDAEEDDDDASELCVICLQGVRDRTVLGECGHQGFCFDCINVWANQSRRCPLCTAPMSQFLLHDLDSATGPTKFYLPPLPSVRPQPLPTTFASTLALRPPVYPFRQRGPEILTSDRDVWNRIRVEREREEEEDMLERAIERRRDIYQHGMFAKHIACNIHTRFKPVPTPRQFAENPDLIARATSFLRRELRVWRNVDVEFLTTYIISLMRSIDIRSEPAVRLLADFLDQPGAVGRDRRGAEHFAHEVYSFLRSPYRDLALYDAIAQYDPVPELPHVGLAEEAREKTGSHNISSLPARPASAPSSSSLESYSPRRPARLASIYTSSSRSHSRSSSKSPKRPRSPGYAQRERVRPPPSSPRRWDQHDVYVARRPQRTSRSRRTLRELEEEVQRKTAQSRTHFRQPPCERSRDLGTRDRHRFPRRDEQDRVSERARLDGKEAERKRTKERIATTGMRGWGEALPDEAGAEGAAVQGQSNGRAATPKRHHQDTDALSGDLLDEHDRLPSTEDPGNDDGNIDASRQSLQSPKASLSMRIFGVAGKSLKQYLNDALRDAGAASRDGTPVTGYLSRHTSTNGDLSNADQATAEVLARAVLSRVGTVEEDEMLDDEIWGVDPAIDDEVFAKAAHGQTKQNRGSVETAGPALGSLTGVDGSVPQEPIPSASGSAAGKARLAIENLERTRTEKKEKLLAKLLRERLARDRSAAIIAKTSDAALPHGGSGCGQDVDPASPVQMLSLTRGENEPLAASDAAGQVDLVELEAKARAKLRLRMKLAKAKAVAAKQARDGATVVATTAYSEVAGGSTAVDGDGADRAAVLRAKLLARRSAQ